MKLLTMLDFSDSLKIYEKDIPRELTSSTVNIHQMYFLVHLQKVILLDCKETSIKSMENIRSFHDIFG